MAAKRAARAQQQAALYSALQNGAGLGDGGNTVAYLSTPHHYFGSLTRGRPRVATLATLSFRQTQHCSDKCLSLGLAGFGTPLSSIVSPAFGELTDEDPTGALNAGLPGGEPAQEELPIGDPGTVLEVKHLDEVLDLATGQWNVKPTPLAQTSPAKKTGKYDCFVFTVIRRFTPANGIGRGGKVTSYNVSKLIEIHSEELKQIGHKVIGQTQGVSWTTKPLRVSLPGCNLILLHSELT